MKKSIFLTDRWVKFTLKKEICIGLTYTQCESDKTELQTPLVFYLSNNLEANSISFHQCEDLTYLQFVMNPNGAKIFKHNNENTSLKSQVELLVYQSISIKSEKSVANNINYQLIMN